MPGNPWDDLETQMQERDLGGNPDAAREHWGAWSSKLETVFLVAVPTETNRNPARILPGREDVYIIPRADCTPGFEGDGNVYFSPKNIEACLVLKPPANAEDLVPQLQTLGRVRCTTEYDKKGMCNLQLSPISDIATVGYYYWKKGSDFVKYAEGMINKDIRVNNEFYVCPVFNQAIADNKEIRTFDIPKMWGLGTPEDLKYYLENYGK